jgi:predicted ATPase
MDKLILENFRANRKRSEIDFAPITILTGKNNSGKSTIMKAILLLSDFLNSDNQLNLEFDGPSAQKHKIDCMENALSWGSESKSFEISFEKDGYRFSFHFADTTLSGLFHRLEFIHLATNSKMAIESLAKDVLDFEIDDVFLESFNPVRTENTEGEKKSLANTLLEYNIEIERIGEEIKLSSAGSPESIELITRKNSLSKKLKDIQKRINELSKSERKRDKSKPIVYNSFLFLDQEHDITLTIISLLRRFLSRYFNSDEFKDEFANVDQQKARNIIFNVPEKLSSTLFFKAHHLGPNRTHQARLYLNQDRNTEINEIMATYSHKKPPKGSISYQFLIKWMSEFEIGTDVRVKDVQATASYLEILNQDKWQNLTDKGFGAGQVLTILLKICNEIQRQKDPHISNRRFRSSQTIIMIEEPETNLHPCLQSRLAEMFYDAFKQFGIRFILETHSEYLIRKTQAIVNRTNDLEAFKLYYIDNSKGIHEMRYREDGKFMDEFGPGFFDESANLAFELF